MFFRDTLLSFKKTNLWLFTTFFLFLVRYRQTIIGPLWIIASPLLFISFLGLLFGGLSSFSTSVFIPHMAVGYISWTLVGGYLSRSPTIFKRNHAYLLQGRMLLTDILLIDNAELIVHFLHQSVLILIVCLYAKTLQSPYALMSIVGLLVVIINGYWLSLVFGIIGIRFKDFGEIIKSINSIAFLATPIIWMPVPTGETGAGRAGIMQVYMNYNPFYHFLEIIRAPLLGQPISTLTIYVTSIITVVGLSVSTYFYYKYRHMVALWI